MHRKKAKHKPRGQTWGWTPRLPLHSWVAGDFSSLGLSYRKQGYIKQSQRLVERIKQDVKHLTQWLACSTCSHNPFQKNTIQDIQGTGELDATHEKLRENMEMSVILSFQETHNLLSTLPLDSWASEGKKWISNLQPRALEQWLQTNPSKIWLECLVFFSFLVYFMEEKKYINNWKVYSNTTFSKVTVEKATSKNL